MNKIKKYYLITELIEGGNINSMLHDTKITLSFQQKINIAHNVAMALDYIFSKGYLHNDISSKNILVNINTFIAYLCDFGLADAINTRCTQKNQWICDPLAIGKPSDDIFSYGIFLWELFSGNTPEKVIKTVCKNHTKLVQQWNKNMAKGHRPSLDNSIPTSIKTLIQACWLSAYERPTITPIITTLKLLLLDPQHITPYSEQYSPLMEFPSELLKHSGNIHRYPLMPDEDEEMTPCAYH